MTKFHFIEGMHIYCASWTFLLCFPTVMPNVLCFQEFNTLEARGNCRQCIFDSVFVFAFWVFD